MDKRIILLGFLFLLITFQVCSQVEDSSEKFAYRSTSISPIGLYFGSETGVTIGADLSFDYRKNIFSLNFDAGTEGNFVGSSDQYVAANILYGRSFHLNKNIFTDLYAGAGYFNFRTYDFIGTSGRKGDIKESTIGFPIGAKFLYQLGPRYSMGLKVGANINSLETIGTVGLVLQWNRKRY